MAVQPDKKNVTIHSNRSNNIFTQMLLFLSVSLIVIEYFAPEGKRTATSRINLVPAFSVSRALRMGGRASVSNLTNYETLLLDRDHAIEVPQIDDLEREHSL